MKFKDFDTNKNAFHGTIKTIVEWLGFISKRWDKISDKNKYIEQNLQPLLTGGFRDPQIKDGEIEWPSPALGTFLRYLGFLNDSYQISPLCQLLINDSITLPEYSIIILSKHRGFLDEIPVINFLPLLCLYIQRNGYQEITLADIKNLSKVEGYELKIDATNQDKNRDDIIFNYVKMTELFYEQNSKLILKENAKSVINFLAENHLKFEIDKRVDKNDKYIYYGDIESGIYKLRDIEFPAEWYLFYPNIFRRNNQIKSILNITSFAECCKNAGLIFSPTLIQRFIASLCTKPFVICSGLSGSGKTKLVQAFVQWICESDKQYKIIPVGADWTNREPLLGYPNGLDSNSYVTPDTGALQLVLEASKDENQNKPYFMILDEMNLSHVERYFADFLSIMESKEKLKLYSGEKRYSHYTKDNKLHELNFIPHEIEWPKNLFIIGTVNIDETTYMFSPKVLDRANVIEFRITPKEMKNFFKGRMELNMDQLFLDNDKSKGGAGQNMAEKFFQLAKVKTITKIPEIEGDVNVLNNFFNELQIVGSEFGYRSATEIERLMYMLTELGEAGDNLLDIAIMQKLLPKLHGSRNKLTKVLPILGGFCLTDNSKIKENYLDKFVNSILTEIELKADTNIKYKISFEKICRMYKNAIENGFASYAEA
jgi:hypothetical protein